MAMPSTLFLHLRFIRRLLMCVIPGVPGRVKSASKMTRMKMKHHPILRWMKMTRKMREQCRRLPSPKSRNRLRRKKRRARKRRSQLLG